MNFYPFHIGDYASHTNHLTDAEDLAYRRMIDLYYMNEQPFNNCSTLARRVKTSVEVVQIILDEFFELQDDGCWHNKRIDAEIAKYQEIQNKKSQAGRASAAARTKSNTCSTPVEPTKNQEPLTITNIKTKKASPSCQVSLPEWIAKDSFEAFIEHRKKLKAPMTHLAQTRLIAELSRLREDGNEPHAVLDQSILNGWKGVFPLKQAQAAVTAGGKAARQQQDKEWLDELTGRSKHNIIDITPT